MGLGSIVGFDTWVGQLRLKFWLSLTNGLHSLHVVLGHLIHLKKGIGKKIAAKNSESLGIIMLSFMCVNKMLHRNKNKYTSSTLQLCYDVNW